MPGGQEHSALCWTPRQLAVGLQQGPPPQNVGPQGSENISVEKLLSGWLVLPTHTGGVVAGPVVRAHLVSERDTVAPHTARDPVTPVSLVTQTHRPVLSCQVVRPGLAVGVGTAGVRSAEIGGGEGAAGDKGVSCVSLGAGTDCLVPGGFTVSIETTWRPASIHVISAILVPVLVTRVISI